MPGICGTIQVHTLLRLRALPTGGCTMSSNGWPLRSPANGRKSIGQVLEETFPDAVREAIEGHFRHGNPVAVWQEGRVVLLHPDGRVEPVGSEGTATPAGEEALDR